MNADFLKQIIDGHAPQLLEHLKGAAGFSQEQAQRFLPEAGDSIGRAVTDKASDLDLGDLASAANISAIAKGIDIQGLAGRTGVSPQQGLDGIKTLLPALLGLVKDRAGDAGSLLEMFGGGKGAAGALGSLKRLGGSFFR